ncbi:translation initiation factor IF-2-like [Bubalus kerabau]|uniref:translation initiation factor IF-2-like n=1 Tax=Bubalus carabanensis TaxID=3119969 RepID=UPI00244ED684|nr:translation initiation factor IF-2-like [Bubalus carabanensis]
MYQDMHSWGPGFEERGRALTGALTRSCLCGRDPRPRGWVTSRPLPSPRRPRRPLPRRPGAALRPARPPSGPAPAAHSALRRPPALARVGRGARRAGRPRSPIPGPTGGGGAAAAALRKPCPVAGHHGNGTAEFRGRRAARPDPRPASARPPAGRAAEEPQEPRAAPAPARRPRPAPLAGPAWRRPEPPETPHPSRLRPAPEVRRGARSLTSAIMNIFADVSLEAGSVFPKSEERLHDDRNSNERRHGPRPTPGALTAPGMQHSSPLV